MVEYFVKFIKKEFNSLSNGGIYTMGWTVQCFPGNIFHGTMYLIYWEIMVAFCQFLNFMWWTYLFYKFGDLASNMSDGHSLLFFVVSVMNMYSSTSNSMMSSYMWFCSTGYPWLTDFVSKMYGSLELDMTCEMLMFKTDCFPKMLKWLNFMLCPLMFMGVYDYVSVLYYLDESEAINVYWTEEQLTYYEETNFADVGHSFFHMALSCLPYAIMLSSYLLNSQSLELHNMGI